MTVTLCYLFGIQGRELLERLEIPDPWRQSVDASVELIDYLERQIQKRTTIPAGAQATGNRRIA